MDNQGDWTILGDHRVADALRTTSRYVETPTPITIATEPGDVPADAFAIGPAVLFSAVERVAPYYSAFEAIEAIKDALDTQSVGQVYGCFTSFRIPRGASADEVAYSALLPALAVTLDLITSPVVRIHARRSSMLADGDSWFVTLRHADETISTIEALAVLESAASLDRELLVEVTASERVLRAEPTRQAIIVEPLAIPATSHPWWEDLNERFLKLVAHRATQPPANAGTRLRATWTELQESATTGEPIHPQ